MLIGSQLFARPSSRANENMNKGDKSQFINDDAIPLGRQNVDSSRSDMNPEPLTEHNVVQGLNIKYLRLYSFLDILNDQIVYGRKNFIAHLLIVVTFLLNGPLIFMQFLGHAMTQVDLQKMTVMHSTSMACLQMTIRYTLLYIRLEKQCKLYGLVRKDFLKSIPESKLEEAKKIYNTYSGIANFFCKTVLLINTFGILLWGTSPSISVDYLQYHTGSIHAVKSGPQKLLGAWYPVPMGETPYFEIVLVYELIYLVWNISLLAVLACILLQPLVCLAAHFAVLGMHISTLKADYGHSGETGKKQDSAIYKELYAILQDHSKLIRYCIRY